MVSTIKLVRFTLLVALIMLSFSDEVHASIKKIKKQKRDEALQTADLEKQGLSKLAELEKLEQAAKDNIIVFTKETYMKYVVKNPRPYDVVVMYSVLQNCDHCLDVFDEYKQTAYSFIQDRGSVHASTKEKKIFYGILYFQTDKGIQEIFKSHGFLTVPYLAVSPMDPKRDAKVETFFEDSDKWLVGSTEVFDAQKQIDFVNNNLRTDVKIKYTFFQILMKNVVGMSIIGVLALIVKYSYNILLNQWTWFVIAIAAWVICTGGLVYSMLNSMPWFKFERNEFGSIVIAEYFMRGQRGQWAGEGYIISVLVTIIGLTFLFLNNLTHFFSDKSQQRTITLVTICMIYLMQSLLLVFYRIKSPWYNPQFDPPDYYQRGTLLQDQGNNI